MVVTIKNKRFKIAFSAYIIIIYVFFGIAATKMIAFTYSISFLIFLSFGVVIDWFLKLIILNPNFFSKKIYSVIYITTLLGIISGVNLDTEKIQEKHTMWKKDEASFYYKRKKNTIAIKELSQKVDNLKDYIIFNCKLYDNIPVMFFNDVVAAYSFVPNKKTYIGLKEKGYNIAVLDDKKLPTYLMTDKSVVKISDYWSEK